MAGKGWLGAVGELFTANRPGWHCIAVYYLEKRGDVYPVIA